MGSPFWRAKDKRLEPLPQQILQEQGEQLAQEIILNNSLRPISSTTDFSKFHQTELVFIMFAFKASNLDLVKKDR